MSDKSDHDAIQKIADDVHTIRVITVVYFVMFIISIILSLVIFFGALFSAVGK